MNQPPRPELRSRAPLLLAVILVALACESTVEPPAGATAVDSSATISVTFDQTMAAATVRPGVTFRVSVQAVPIPGSIVSDPELKRFVFVPSTALPGSREIDVLVRDVADQAGTWLPSPFGFSFRTSGPSPVPPRMPANPYPADDATQVPTDTTFTWTGGTDGGDPVVYDFWLGTNAGNMTQRATDLATTAYVPGALPFATAHAWRVVARSAGGTTTGPVWTFTTRDAPPTNTPPPSPCTPYPADQATVVPDTTRFQWGCITDPDSDPVTFDVYLGTTTNPSFVATVSSPLFVSPDPLFADTLYHWRIVTDDGRGGRTAGPLWSFRTAAAPPPNEPPSMPSSPDPPHDATAILTTATLTWSGGVDPDGDSVEFVVFLERDDATDPDSVAIVAARSYTPPLPLDAGATYYWRIKARDSHGAVTSGPVWSFTTNAPPTDPCNPDPADGEAGVGITVRLSWECGEDPEGQAVVYDVYLGTTPDPAVPIATVPIRTYLAGGVERGVTYYWRIVARDELASEAPGPVWSFTTEGPNEAPPAPCTPYPADQATAVPDTTRFQWGCAIDPDGDQLSFVVRLGPTEDPQIVATVSTPLYIPDSPLVADTRYYWWITADDGRGGQTPGPLWTFVTALPPNELPTPLIDPVPDNDATGIPTDAELAWNGGDDPQDAVVYVVFFERGAADPDSVAVVTEKSYTPSLPLEPGGEYYWRIEARDERGGVRSSPVWHFTANLPPSPPCSPNPPDGGSEDAPGVTLRWGCGSDPEEQDVVYDVYFGLNPDPPGPVATVNNRRLSLGGLQPERVYYWRVVARDEAGGQITGPVWSFSTTGDGPAGSPQR